MIIIGFHVAYLADPGQPVGSPKRHNRSLQAQAVHYQNNNSNNNNNKACTGLMHNNNLYFKRVTPITMKYSP